MNIKFRWLGVAGIEIVVGNKHLLIDPMLTRPPFSRVLFGKTSPNTSLLKEKIKRADYIFVTDSHFDHLMDAPEIAKYTGAIVFGSLNTCQILKICGVPKKQIRKIRAGDKISLNQFQVVILPATHNKIPGFFPGKISKNLQPPLKLRDYRLDITFSFLINVAGKSFLIWSDPKSSPNIKTDVLFFVPEGTKEHLGRDISASKIVVPIHWDDFFRPLAERIIPSYQWPKATSLPQRYNMASIKKTLENISKMTKVIIPEPFRYYIIY